MARFTIACIGNSHTAGFPGYDPAYGGNPESTYIFHLASKLKNEKGSQVEFTNHGICGQTSSLIARRIPGILKKISPTHAILLSGANDIGWGTDTSKIVETITKSIAMLEENSCIPVLCNIPPMIISLSGMDGVIKNRVEKLNQRLESLAKHRNIPFVDLWKNLAAPYGGGLQKEFDSGDGVHLSIEGYKRVADIVYDVIFPLLV